MESALTHDFLLEIGCEELPADYLPAFLDWDYPNSRGLAASAAEVLSQESKISWNQIQSFGTPRRLVLYLRGMEPIVREELEGPPISIAFDQKGNPTAAAIGFAKRQGVPVSRLKKKESARGARLVLERTVPVTQRLTEAIPTILNRISSPKTMRWEASGLRFARPIRWIVSLYGSQVVRVRLGPVQSGRETFGTRRSAEKRVAISSPAAYLAALKRIGVHLEEGRFLRRSADGSVEAAPLRHPKRELLLRQLARASKRIGGQLPDSTTEEFNDLLDTLTFLSEDPHVEAGSFKKEYLDLPSEVLATSMAKHLRMFSVVAPDGKKLIPRFLAVLEGRPKRSAVVMANIERILEARFSDARFFYQEDTKSPLEAKVSRLGDLVFHEKLGTVADRIPRLERLALRIAQQVHAPEEVTRLISRAARLGKADLVTQMVREFPSLQGVVGGEYARGSGEPAELAQGLREIYRPRSTGDPPPSTWIGAILSSADRLDTLLGYFGVGLRPTGSVDPYGLRRQAMGLVRIWVESKPPISFLGGSIDSLFDEGIQSWGARISVDPLRLKRELREFLRERFEWLAIVREGIARELVAAVTSSNNDDLADAWQRLQILNALWSDSKERPLLLKAAKVVERTGRMVQSSKEAAAIGEPEPSKLTLPEEQTLWKAWTAVKAATGGWIEKREYVKATAEYGKLYPQLHQFFEKVFVMDENPDLRRNRLAMMKEIHFLYANAVGDLSKLPLPPEL